MSGGQRFADKFSDEILLPVTFIVSIFKQNMMKYQRGNFFMFGWKKTCRVQILFPKNSSIEPRVEAEPSGQSGARRPLRHKMQMRKSPSACVYVVCCITFYIHTLPQKFILLFTIRADTFFPWHDSSSKTE